MARLFIDCDDTLVLWLGEDGEGDGGPNPYGGGKEKWEPNRALIAAIESSREEYEEVVVWTGGGSDYARVWRDRLLPWAHHAIAHCLEARGRMLEGVAFLNSVSDTWSDCNSFMQTHNWWHLALFLIDLDRTDEALALHDERVWGVWKEFCEDQANAVSLLAR